MADFYETNLTHMSTRLEETIYVYFFINCLCKRKVEMQILESECVFVHTGLKLWSFLPLFYNLSNLFFLNKIASLDNS